MDMDEGSDQLLGLYEHYVAILHVHTGKAAIENANTIEERRSKIVRNRVFDCHLSTIGTTVSIDF